MTGLEIIARINAMPKEWKCTTREHLTATEGQAKNYSVAEARKIGRDLVNRETGATVRVVAVTVERV